MGKQTGIEWTDRTWNPWHGCRKVSAGCKHCYMYRDKGRYGQDPTTVLRSKTTFNDPLKWAAPARVFTCSWSDFFIEEADAWRAEAWDIIRQTPHLTYQILTKRPQLIPTALPPDWGAGYPNVWIGVSVESQKYAEERIPLLAHVPARVRFLSMEPLLGAVGLASFLGRCCNGQDCACGGKPIYPPPVDWVIVGGESGPQARPMEVGWARQIVEDCDWAGVPVFVKQLGGHPDKRGRLADFPLDLQRREFPDDH